MPLVAPGNTGTWLDDFPLHPQSKSLIDADNYLANYVPKNTPAFLGQVPTYWYDAQAEHHRKLEELPQGSESWQKAKARLDRHQELVTDVERVYQSEHEKFLESGLKPSEYAKKVFREHHDPSGWRETFAGSMLEMAYDVLHARPTTIGAEFMGTFNEGYREYGESLRSRLNRDAAIQAEFDLQLGWKRHPVQISRSVLQYALPAAVGGPWAAIAYNMADSFYDGVHEGQQAGLTNGAEYAYGASQAIIEGGVTSLFQKLGLQGLEAGKLGLNRQFLRSVAEELPEETSIAFLSQVARKTAGVDPQALDADRLNRIYKDTLIQTVGTVGAVHYLRRFGDAFNDSGELNEKWERQRQLADERPTADAPGTSLVPTGFEPRPDNGPTNDAEPPEDQRTRVTSPVAGLLAGPEQAVNTTAAQIHKFDPELADRIADLDETPSRSDFEEAGLPNTNQAFRQQVQEELRRQRFARRAAETWAETETHSRATDPNILPEDVRASFEQPFRNSNPDDTTGFKAAFNSLGGDVRRGYRDMLFRKASSGAEDLKSMGFAEQAAYHAKKKGILDSPEDLDVILDYLQTHGESKASAAAALKALWDKKKGRRESPSPGPSPDPAQRSAPASPASSFRPSDTIPPEQDFTGPGIVPPWMRRRRGASTVQGDFTAPTPDIEARIAKAKKPARDNWFGRIREMLRPFERRVFSRPTLKTGLWERPELAPFRFQLDQLRDTHRIAADETIRLEAYILDNLPDSEHLDAFSRVLGARDMARGRQDLDNQEYLYWGFENDQQIRDYLAQVEHAAQQNDSTIGEALRRRAAIHKGVVQQLVSIGRLKPEALTNQDYYHREILFYRNLQRGYGRRRGTLKNAKKGFEHQRRKDGGALEEDFDPVSDYLVAETEWLLDALRTIRTHEIHSYFKTRSDEYVQELQDEAEQRGLKRNEWRQILRERDDIAEYLVDKDSTLHVKRTVPEKAMAHLERLFKKGILSQNDFDSVQKQELLVHGFNATGIVVPVEVKAELERLDKVAQQEKGPGAEVYDTLFRAFKEWTLHNPEHIVPYNARNLVGDAEALFAGAPGAYKQLGRATKEMTNYMLGRKRTVPKDLADAIHYGAVNAAFTDVELETVKQNRTLSRFDDQGRPLQKLRRGANWISMYREGIVRYSAYLEFLDKLNAGKLRDYGASKKSTIKALQQEFGNEAAAAQMSKDLLLDYADVSLTGQWLRTKLIPFWSFIELNFRRQTRLLANAFYQLPKDRFQEAIARGETPLAASTDAALAAGIATGRQGALLATIFLWNALRYPDEWEELSPSDRKSASVVLGRNEDGTVRVFRRISVVGDVLEWFGVNEAVALYDMLQSDRISGKEYANQILKSIVQKGVDALGPGYRGIPETAFGKSLWPDAFNPRAVDRVEHGFSQLGLEELYREYKGLVYQDGSRARPHFWQRMLVGVSDPRQNAISASYDLIDHYLASRDKPRTQAPSVSEWRNFRYAAAAEDYEAFAEMKDKWLDKGKTFKEFVQWTKRLDPLHAVHTLPGSSKQNEAEFQNYLTDLDRRTLALARDYAYTLQARLIDWWKNGP